MPPRRQQWSLALPVACGYMNRGAAASLDLPGGAEICNLALFPHGHGKLIIQEIQIKKLSRVIYKPKATNSSRLHLGSFPTQGAPRLFRVGVCCQPTQGDELTRLIWCIQGHFLPKAPRACLGLVANPRQRINAPATFADDVVVAVVVAQRRDRLGGSIGSSTHRRSQGVPPSSC